MSRSNSISKLPPAFQAVNEIELVSVKDSKIISVSVYTGRAEVTRLFKFAVKTGQNQLTILGLPLVLDQDSLKVEGRGAATIHDVTISTIAPPPVRTTSPELITLQAKQKRSQKALARAQKSLASLESYLASVRAEHLDVSKLQEVVQNYDKSAEALDERVSELEEEIKVTAEAIDEEKKRLVGPAGNEKLNLKATIGVFAESEGEIKIALIYAVNRATWGAGYDIRVDMQTKDTPVNLIYKASITQSTGEDWDDVPLTLETAAPTFGVGVPTLMPWTLSVAHPVYMKSGLSKKGHSPPGAAMFSASVPPPQPAPRAMLRRAASSLAIEEEESINHRELQVSSKGGVSATFGVPGLITIPSDGDGHNVTIARLNLDASMSWVCVPKKDTRVHLKAKIKNASEYTLLAGSASVYVDGSFISKSDVPLVSPDESFACPLGLDPSVRVTYHPRSKKTAQTGLYSKTAVHSFTQRITVHNTKAGAAGVAVQVIDQVPVAEDASIVVKLQQPAITQPGADGSFGTLTSGGAEGKAPPPVKVSAGVVASWMGSEDEDADLDSLGKEGKFAWTCSVPSQAKVGLVLQYEISAPARTKIAGI